MVRVRVFSDFCSSETCREICERLWPSDSQIEWTSEGPFTHALLLNQAMPRLFLPPANVIGLALEPPQFLLWKESQVTYMKHTAGKYCIGSPGHTSPFVCHHGFLWHIAPKDPPKTALMSIMVSAKRFAPGHQYRHDLVSAILKTSLPIDIYGRGCPASSDPRIKGHFTESEPYDAYSFHIAIENFQTKAYFSEKVSNPLQRRCVPVYLGAEVLPFESSVIRLTGSVESDMKLLSDICATPDLYRRPIDPESISSALDLRKFLKQEWNLIQS